MKTCRDCKHARPQPDERTIKCKVCIERDFVRNGTGKALEALPSFSCEKHEGRES